MGSVGLLINFLSPNGDDMTSILEHSYDVLSLLHQRFDLALNLSKTTVKIGLCAIAILIMRKV